MYLSVVETLLAGKSPSLFSSPGHLNVYGN